MKIPSGLKRLAAKYHSRGMVLDSALYAAALRYGYVGDVQFGGWPQMAQLKLNLEVMQALGSSRQELARRIEMDRLPA